MLAKLRKFQKPDLIILKKNEDAILEALGLRRIHPSFSISDVYGNDTILKSLGLCRIHPSVNIHLQATKEVCKANSETNLNPIENNETEENKRQIINIKSETNQKPKLGTKTFNKTKFKRKVSNKQAKSENVEEKEVNQENGSIIDNNNEEKHLISLSDNTENEDELENKNLFMFIKIEEHKRTNAAETKNVSLNEGTKKIGLKKETTIRKTCRICNKTFKNLESLKQHQEDIHSSKKPYCCPKCDVRFVGLEELVAHSREHAGKMPYICKVCKESFDDKNQYKEHLPLHEFKKIPRARNIVCEYCSKDFLKPCDLERHRRVHTGEKPFACMICNKRFQQAHNVTKHLLIHSREKHFQCEICNKIFGRSDVLTRHMLIHSVHKPFTCNFCDKSFNRNSQLGNHVEKHHPSNLDLKSQL